MESTLGKNIKVTIFGGSHEKVIGCTINGFPEKTLDFDHEKLQHFLDLRAPGGSPFATKRKEPDRFEIAADDSFDDICNDRQMTFIIRNTDQRSGDYKTLRNIPRPGHADYTARIRYGDELNMAGGGPFSARMTAPLCIAGGIALQYLEKKGIRIAAHLLSVGDVQDQPFDPMEPDISTASESLNRTFLPVLDTASGKEMADTILSAAAQKDSIGGVIEVAATGIPAGIGGAMYDGLESFLAPIYFGIPAVKGLEFGAGFAASRMKGSENNDAYTVTDGHITTKTNNAGGILGGITNGMPLIARIAFKPTPSIARMQDSVDLQTMQPEKLEIRGRHDPCVAVRAVPIVIAATALGILDAMLDL